jgi:hypothetical protein
MNGRAAFSGCRKLRRLGSLMALGLGATTTSGTPRPAPPCVERGRIIVGKLSPEPVYNNKIFTRGFTFFLEAAGDSATMFPRDEDYKKLSGNIERAFQSAVLLWMQSLNQIKTELEPAMVAYIESLISRSNSFQLLTPPPVLQVVCRQNAMFVVRVFLAVGEQFPDSAETLAKAQIAGRTILLNGRSTQQGRNRVLVWDLAMREVKVGDRVNLIATMAHELGHAFGLHHRQDRTKSIMNPPFYLLARPSKVDARALASVLRANIEGGRPGELDPTMCDGLTVLEPDSATTMEKTFSLLRRALSGT